MNQIRLSFLVRNVRLVPPWLSNTVSAEVTIDQGPAITKNRLSFCVFKKVANHAQTSGGLSFGGWGISRGTTVVDVKYRCNLMVI